MANFHRVTLASKLRRQITLLPTCEDWGTDCGGGLDCVGGTAKLQIHAHLGQEDL